MFKLPHSCTHLTLLSEVTQSYLTLCDPMDYSLSGSSIHGIFQARLLQWVAISFSRGSSWPRDWTQVSCIVGRRFYHLSHQEVPHSSKVILKILQARLQQYMKHELPDVEAGFRKGRVTRDQIANICWSSRKQESSRKISTSALLTMPMPLTMWTTTLENSERDGNTRPPDLPLEKSVWRSGSNS